MDFSLYTFYEHLDRFHVSYFHAHDVLKHIVSFVSGSLHTNIFFVYQFDSRCSAFEMELPTREGTLLAGNVDRAWELELRDWAQQLGSNLWPHLQIPEPGQLTDLSKPSFSIYNVG